MDGTAEEGVSGRPARRRGPALFQNFGDRRVGRQRFGIVAQAVQAPQQLDGNPGAEAFGRRVFREELGRGRL